MKINRIHFDTIHSTNTWSKEHAEEFALDSLTLVTADSQSHGRGRFKRNWVSPPNQNIYATFNFFADLKSNHIGNYPQALAIAAVRVLRSYHLKAQIKWPNDVVVSGKKIAGILCETTLTEKGLCVVLGIGLNVNMPSDLLMQIDRPATSLTQETQNTFEVEAILNSLLDHFLPLYVVVKGGHFELLFSDLKDFICHTPGDLLCFQDYQNRWKGQFQSINQDGSLNLILEDKSLKRCISGEIIEDLLE